METSVENNESNVFPRVKANSLNSLGIDPNFKFEENDDFKYINSKRDYDLIKE